MIIMHPENLLNFLCFMLFLFCACEHASDSVKPSVNEKSEKLNQTDYIFDEDTIRTYEILISEDNLRKIDNDPVAEEYVEGIFIVENDTFGSVGIRYKGNEGAWWDCVSNPPTGGSKICEKLSMKIKINWNKDTTFYGLKKFQLHSLNTDRSQLRERLGYWFYREMKVPAPRVVHVILKINGKYHGMFAHVEQIDGRFTRYHFKDGTGNLYKEAWPVDGNGIVNNESVFRNKLETNTDESPSFEMVRSFGLELQNSDNSNVQQVLEKWMNVETALSLAAVSYTLDDDDGLFHWYEYGDNDPRPHNFYLYEEPSEKKIYLIPWDLDHMLKSVADPEIYNAVELIDDWGEISENCQMFGNGWPQRSAACDKLVAGLVMYKDTYLEILNKINNGPFSHIESKLTEWENQLRPVTEMLYDNNNNLVSVQTWESAMSELKKELVDARTKLLQSVANLE
ncbi:MAG TPA: CotH kinase family protein [Chitinispirillaceae bacterium]|nr:CotH kinase family protein [Chitinispirillaceae bacterium]